jgi:hypothetical protein
MFVMRNEEGKIIAVSREAMPGIAESLAADDPSLMQYLRDVGVSTRTALEASDLEVIRVLEDLIEVLISRGVIQFTDLPEAAQNKLLKRRSIRRAGGFTLFEDDEGIL